MKVWLVYTYFIAGVVSIIIRDDTPDRNYIVPEEDWSGVFSIDPSGNQEVGLCTATLVSEIHAITAARCFKNGKWKDFGVTINGTKNKVIYVYLNRCFDYSKDGPNGGDFVIIKLQNRVQNANVYKVY